MTTIENVRSETILREIRARVLTLVKNPPIDSKVEAWDIELRALGQLEIIYSRPEIIPVGAPEAQRYQARP